MIDANKGLIANYLVGAFHFCLLDLFYNIALFRQQFLIPFKLIIQNSFDNL